MPPPGIMRRVWILKSDKMNRNLVTWLMVGPHQGWSEITSVKSPSSLKTVNKSLPNTFQNKWGGGPHDFWRHSPVWDPMIWGSFYEDLFMLGRSNHCKHRCLHTFPFRGFWYAVKVGALTWHCHESTCYRYAQWQRFWALSNLAPFM